MNDLGIFAIGHQRSRWLTARVAAVATNVANADTPGYVARDVAPFEAALLMARSEPERTQPGHFLPDSQADRKFGFVPRSASESKHSGNAVSLEVEMASLGELRTQQSSVVGVLGAFQRMLLSSTKG